MGYILITGASGFIGQHLLKHIASEKGVDKSKIVLLSLAPIPGYSCILHQNYKFTKNDFLKIGVKEIEAVIHAGAFTPKSSADANRYEDNFKNVTNIHHLLANLPGTSVKFIFLSTLDIYAHTEGIINEQTPALPSGFYGMCKLFCEQMVEQYVTQVGGVLQILRLGHIYGPGEEAYKKLIPETIRRLKQDERPKIFTQGTEKRSYLNVKDCTRAIWNALQLGEYPGPINIVSSQSLSILEIVKILITVSGKKTEPEVLKNNIPYWDIVFDNSKMKKYLGEESVPFVEGLREEYESFKIW